MKCTEIEKKSQRLIDDELTTSESRKLNAHLSLCDDCRKKVHLQTELKKALERQPQILPSNGFDNKMLSEFHARLNVRPENQNSPAVASFAFGKLAYALGLGALILTAGLGFVVGRMSVSSSPHFQTARGLNSKPTSEKNPVTGSNTPKDKPPLPAEPQIKTVVKYVKVPIIREKIVERKVYLTPKRSRRNKLRSKSERSTVINEDIAAQFNLKDMRPPEKLTYKIIKKGDEE